MRLVALLALLPLPAMAEVSMTDATGAVLTFDAPPERIVCLSISCLHDLALLGRQPIAAWPDYYAAHVVHPDVFGEAGRSIEIPPGSDSSSPDLEAFAALDADVFIGGDSSVYPEEFTDAVAPVFESVGEYEADGVEALGSSLVQLGDAFGQGEEARAAVRRAADRLDAYQRLRPGEGASFVSVRLASPEDASMWVPPCAAILATLGRCLNETGGWTNVTSEGLLALDPDVVLVEDWGSADIFLPGAWSDVPLWSEVRAVREGRVHVVPLHRAVPYSILSLDLTLDALMPLLYPDTFPAPLSDAQVAAALVE